MRQSTFFEYLENASSITREREQDLQQSKQVKAQLILHHAKAIVNGISNVLKKETLKGDIIHRC
jgi:hypothetical protein